MEMMEKRHRYRVAMGLPREPQMTMPVRVKKRGKKMNFDFNDEQKMLQKGPVISLRKSARNL